MGYEADEAVCRNCRFLQGPGTAAADVETLRRSSAAHPDHISVELLNYRKDGSSFWNQLAISPVVNEARGVIYYFASQHNVTERQWIEEMEATERLLLAEVDHRAMNALAVVQSIVRRGRADNIADLSSAIAGWTPSRRHIGSEASFYADPQLSLINWARRYKKSGRGLLRE